VCALWAAREKKTKEPAKKTLMAAFDQQKGTLRVPAHILAREKQAKKQFEAAAKQIEAEAKKADAAAKKAEEEKRKRMEKFEEIAKVRQRALADLAKVDAFEKKLLGGSAGSSKPKAAGASTAAAMAKKKTPAKQAATAPASTSAARKTTTKTTTAGAATTTKKSATTKIATSTVRTEPDNTYLPFLSDRQPRPYGQAASSSSASFGVQATHQSGSSVTGRRTKQAANRSEPASVPSSRVKAEPVVKAEVYETKPRLAPHVQQGYNFHYEYDEYDEYPELDDARYNYGV
jgi:hypothetical protein